MRDSIHPTRLTRPQRARLLAVATLVGGILMAGCAGGSSGPATATVGRASTRLSDAATTPSVPTSPSTSTDSSPSPAQLQQDAVAFSNCMRANGVPSFPDPRPGGGVRFDVPAGTGASPAFRAAQAKCQKLLPNLGLPGSGAPPSPQTMAKLLEIARCMRRHGISGFPDPRTSAPANPAASGAAVITDFDGAILLFPSTIDLQAPAYRQALTACGAPPLGLPH